MFDELFHLSFEEHQSENDIQEGSRRSFEKSAYQFTLATQRAKPFLFPIKSVTFV